MGAELSIYQFGGIALSILASFMTFCTLVWFFDEYKKKQVEYQTLAFICIDVFSWILVLCAFGVIQVKI